MDRALCAAGALCGAAGVIFSAVASHAGGGTVGVGASFLLMHAPAFLALGFAPAPKAARLAGWALFVGVALFAADLIVRNYGMDRLFPMAAPAGGTLMIVGWLAVGVTALVARKPA